MAVSKIRVDMRVGESVRIDQGRIVVTLEEKSGQRARLSIEADQGVSIEPPGRPKVAKQAMKGVSVART